MLSGTRNKIITLCIKLHACYIFQTKHTAVTVCTNDYIAKFFLSNKTAFDRNNILECLTPVHRSCTNITCRYLLVLCFYCRDDFCCGHFILCHFRGIKPNTHTEIRTEFLHITDTRNRFQLINIIHTEIIFQKGIIISPIW